MAETTHLTVIIAGRSYPLIVEKADEHHVLQTVKTINERITQYQAQYQSKDKQDCLAMTLLEVAIGATKPSEVKQKDDNPAIQKSLSAIEKALDDILV
jgi:Cell division protein ZapA